MAIAPKRMGIMKKIYIVHGWTYTLERWRPLSELLKQKDVEPILLKVPGLTESLEQPWDLDNYVAWLNKQLAQEKQPVILVGHSNGGRISLAFTARYPQKVKQLVLIDSAGIADRDSKTWLKRFAFKQAAIIGKKITTSPVARKALYKFARVGDYYTATPSMRKTMANLLKSDVTIDPAKITVPTTIIWGEKDKTTPLADGKKLNELISGSKLFVIDGAKHAPYFTHSQEVADIIVKALK
jgi:pimeloyl-ACP methyl ester carboxylesterase